MEKWIILLTQNMECLKTPSDISRLVDIAAIDAQGCLLIFDSEEEAENYRNEQAIDGKPIQLPKCES